MRYLTITRKKTFVASLTKIKVYIEDESNELTIADVPCKKLGEIKNGETVTFEIDERSAKIFVIGDTLSKGYCSEFYQLPDGSEDIQLVGQNKFNLARGNAFIFENNETEEAIAYRKKGFGVGLAVLIAAVAIGAIIGVAIALI